MNAGLQTKRPVSEFTKGKDRQVQEVQRLPKKMNPKRAIARHMIIKMPVIKDKEDLKSSKRQAVSYLQGSSYKPVS